MRGNGIPLPEGMLHEILGRCSVRVVRLCHRLPWEAGCPKVRLDRVWRNLV